MVPSELGPLTALALIGTVLVWPATAQTAEIELRAECRSSGPVVTLGDVAVVRAGDSSQADALAALELFAAPAPGAKRFLTVRQVQDMLLIRGVNLLDHRISGASRVVVLGAGEEMQRVDRAPLPASTATKAERQVCEAVVRYLKGRASDTESWIVNVALDDAQARLVASAKSEISVQGGTPPWQGVQRFEIIARSSDGPIRFPFDAEVTVSPLVVVSARAFPKGVMICAADLRLEQAGSLDGASEGFSSIEDVVGKETTRAIPAGRILDRGSVRSPLLVRRGEVITVYARSAGIRVRTTARAREEGSLGDLITVESLLDRATYFAQVSGIQEVEVYAQPTRARDE